MNLIRISATLELNDAVVHSESFALGEGAWVGDHPDARVPFEGAVLHVLPHPSSPTAVSVAGGSCPVVLRPGGSLRVEMDDGVAVTLGVVRERRLARESLFAGDVRLLVLTAAVVLFGMWWDTAHRWSRTHPSVVAELEALPALWSRAHAEVPGSPVDEGPTKVHQPVRFDD
ncbi:MAG: hypothetical protein H6736_01920 [Alphaproteobacteria bacterium]|nr:hypothetical protein [Alphaproteobacteria bacterium]MCB9690549.1 hypothetical protein [Alphaproteobacteria bacterium]